MKLLVILQILEINILPTSKFTLYFLALLNHLLLTAETMKLPAPQDTFLLGQLLRVNNEQDGWHTFIEIFRQHFNLHSSHLNIYNNKNLSFIFTVGAGWFPDDEMLSKYLNEYIEHDPIVLAISTREAGKMYASNFLAQETDIYNSKFWHTWVIKQGFAEAAGACISNSGDNSTTLVTSRTKEQGIYNDDELERLNCLLPYIDEALKTSIAFSQQQGSSLRLQAVINQYRMPVAILTEYSEVAALNTMMSSYLAKQQQLKLIDQSFAFTNPENTKKLNLSLFDMSQTAKGINISINGLRKIEINNDETLYFEQLSEPLGDINVNLGVLVYIVSQKYLGRISPDSLQAIFSLTTAESAICALLLDSKKPKEIAQLTSKSIHTVREQISNIYTKTGCNNQISLVNLIASIPSASKETSSITT